jgi:hypothetical protein
MSKLCQKPDCKAIPLPDGDGFCLFHSPRHAEAVKQARIRGGKHRRYPKVQPPKSAAEAITVAGEAVARMLNGTMNTAEGKVTSQLINSLLEAIKVGEIDSKLKALNEN